MELRVTILGIPRGLSLQVASVENASRGVLPVEALQLGNQMFDGGDAPHAGGDVR